MNIHIAKKEIISKIKEKNLAVTVYSNKNIKSSQINKLLRLGVDSVFIDNIVEVDQLTKNL